ncbi:MAG: NUDIX pyrophosphatase [Ignavibacteriaceae bacterium]|nr:NUDIX pyrophosphatase [Ignavibacteriaceae bacterium]
MKIKSDLVELHIFKMIDDEMQFLLLKRSTHKIYPGVWQMVSGHLDKNETAIQTALRELNEETGIKPFRLWIAPNINSLYSPEDDSITMIPVFAAQVKNDRVIISDEHSEFKWLNSEEAKKLLAWDGQRKSVDIIKEYFTNRNSIRYLSEISL